MLERPSDDLNHSLLIQLEWQIPEGRLRRKSISRWFIMGARPKVPLTVKKTVDLRNSVVLDKVLLPR